MAASKLAFLILIIVLSRKIQYAEGRNLEFKDKNKFSPTHKKISQEDPRKLAKHGKILTKDYFSFTSYNNKAKFSPTTTSLPPRQALAVSQPPPPGHVDSFRPTGPGHSPGIGHSLRK